MMTALEIEKKIKDLREKLKPKNDQILYRPIDLLESLEPGDILVAREKSGLNEKEKFIKILDIKNSTSRVDVYPVVIYNADNFKCEGFTGFSEERWEIIYIDKDPKKIDTRFMDFCKNFCIMDCEGCPIKQIINEKT